MLYGSFWGGCHVLKLKKTTGFAEEEGIGVCIARRPKWQSGSMEGPYMVCLLYTSHEIRTINNNENYKENNTIFILILGLLLHII